MNNEIIFFDLPNDQNAKVYQSLKHRFNIVFSRSYEELQELIFKYNPFLVIVNKDNFTEKIKELFYYLQKTSPQTVYLVYSFYKNKKEKNQLIRSFVDDCIFSKKPAADIISKIISYHRRIKHFFEYPKIIKIGDLKINYNTREISRNNISVTLTDSQFKILNLLISKPNHAFTRKEILYQSFPKDNHLSRRAVDVYIRRLREKIHALKSDQEIIVTVHGLGYKFYDQ